MIDRESAWCLLTEFTQSESLRKHALAVEACMRACARKWGSGAADEELWGVVGLIHDFDYERWPTAEEHPYKGNEILKERGWPDEIRRAIMSHAEYSGVTRDSQMEKALFACDELAGFITAVRADQAGQVAGRGRCEVGEKEDEGQGLRAQGEPRRHHQGRGGSGCRSGRAHRVLCRSAQADREGTGAGWERGEDGVSGGGQRSLRIDEKSDPQVLKRRNFRSIWHE